MYLEAQLPQGRLPSHLVLRARHLSQLAQSATVGFLEATGHVLASSLLESFVVGGVVFGSVVVLAGGAGGGAGAGALSSVLTLVSLLLMMVELRFLLGSQSLD